MPQSETGRREFLVGAAFVGVGVASGQAFATAADSYEVVLRANGNDHLDPRFRFEPATNTFWFEDAHVRFGSRRSTNASPDFEYDPDARKIMAPSILCHEIGDSVDIGGGRTGPDNADPYRANPETTEPTARLVRFWGRSWVSDTLPDSNEPIGWDAETDGESFSVCGEMTVEASGDQTPTSRPGRLVLRSTRPGEHLARDGLIVTRTQQLAAAEDGSSEAPAWTFLDQTTGFSRREVGDGRVFLDASVGGERVADFRAPRGTATGMALTYFDESGEMRFEAVEVGPPDSGGAGYRMLRIGN